MADKATLQTTEVHDRGDVSGFSNSRKLGSIAALVCRAARKHLQTNERYLADDGPHLKDEFSATRAYRRFSLRGSFGRLRLGASMQMGQRFIGDIGDLAFLGSRH